MTTLIGHEAIAAAETAGRRLNKYAVSAPTLITRWYGSDLRADYEGRDGITGAGLVSLVVDGRVVATATVLSPLTSVLDVGRLRRALYGAAGVVRPAEPNDVRTALDAEE